MRIRVKITQKQETWMSAVAALRLLHCASRSRRAYVQGARYGADADAHCAYVRPGGCRATG
jgi:hypothetical protein